MKSIDLFDVIVYSVGMENENDEQETPIALATQMQMKSYERPAPMALRTIVKKAREATDPDALRVYAKSRNTIVLMAVASNLHTPRDAILRLCVCGDPEVQQQIACRQNVSKDTLSILAYNNNSDYILKSLVASHQNTPQIVLDELAKDKDEDVAEMAQNVEVIIGLDDLPY